MLLTIRYITDRKSKIVISYKHRFYVCVRSRDLETIWSNGFVLSKKCKLDYETKKLEAWKQQLS